MLQVQEINIILSISASITSMLLAVYAWGRRHIQGAIWFTGLLAAVSWVTWWYTFEAAGGSNVATYVTFSKIEYIALTFIPMLWLGFALTFSGRERAFSSAALAGLVIIPLITIALAFSNEWHGLIWKQPRFTFYNGAPVFTPEYGAGFWVYVIYSYTIFLVGSVILLRHTLNAWRLYRAQAILVLVGTAFPWISNFISIFDSLNPFPYLYLNALFLGLCMVCFAFALFRLGLLDVVPMAYDTILNNIPDGVIVVDLNNRILAINRTVRPFLDTPDQDPIGKPLRAAFSKYGAYFQGVGQPVDYRGELHLDDRVVALRISPVSDGRGNLRGRLFVVSDVTAQAQMEQAQRDERLFAETMRDIGTMLNSALDTGRVMALILENLEQLVSHSHANIMIVDDDGYTTRIRQHRGYSPEAVTRLERMVFDYRTFPLLLRSANATEPVIVPDTRQDKGWQMMEHFDDIQSFASMPILTDGKLVGFINIDSTTPGVIKTEVSRRLQIFAQQAALAIKNARLYERTRQQTEELKHRVDALTITQQVYKEIAFSFNVRMLLEIAFDATLRLMLADGGYIALERENGLEVTQSYGHYALDELSLIIGQRKGSLGQAITERRLMAVLPPEPLVSAMKGARAQVALPLYDREEGEESTFYGIIVVETQKPERFTEDRLQLLSLIGDRVSVALQNVRLVNIVRDRAAELETLYERVSRLEQLKSDMIRIAAHDLKNPLTVILTYLKMLLEESEIALDPTTMYPPMLKSAERMLQIIQNILSLERIERVAEQQTMRAVDLPGLVSRAVNEFTRRATEKSQSLEFIKPDHDFVVKGDEVQLYEAITNFISNAIKYTPDGGAISVKLTQEDDTARLEVRDNGYGIPEDQQSKLFQPFSRAQSRETKTIEGTGLGLHLTKRIIERQGGTIIFNSVYQQGSMFGFNMPVYHPTEEEQMVENLDDLD